MSIVYLAVILFAALFIRNPPAGYTPPGYQPITTGSQSSSARDFKLTEALRTWQWYGLWLILFLNTTAGIAIISQASPMAQEITRVDAAAAAAMVGIISIANGAGASSGPGCPTPSAARLYF